MPDSRVIVRIVLRSVRDRKFKTKAEANIFAFNYLAGAIKSGTWTPENLLAATNALETAIGEVK